MKAHENYFDVLLNTVSANHSYETYLKLLNLDGKLLIVGLPAEHPAISPFKLLKNRRILLAACLKRRKCSTIAPGIISFQMLS
jgi:uncharacterized zinc-type alcohol dehydrogenase-like protein